MIIATFLQVMAQYFMRKETLLADKWLDSIIKKILSDSYTETLGARYHAYLNPHKANIGQCLSRFGNTHYQFGDYALDDASLWNSSTPVMIPIDPMVDLSRLPRGLVCPVW
jgi:hypothetical protein